MAAGRRTWLAVTLSMYAARGSGTEEAGPATGQGTLTTAAPPSESSCAQSSNQVSTQLSLFYIFLNPHVGIKGTADGTAGAMWGAEPAAARTSRWHRMGRAGCWHAAAGAPAAALALPRRPPCSATCATTGRLLLNSRRDAQETGSTRTPRSSSWDWLSGGTGPYQITGMS